MCSSLPLSRVDPSSVGLLSCAAFMGAPVIISEKLVAGVETSLALEALQRVLASGVCGQEEGRRGSESVRVRERQLSGGKKAWIADPDDLKKIDVSDPSQINLVSLKILHIIYLSSTVFQFYILPETLVSFKNLTEVVYTTFNVHTCHLLYFNSID